MVVSAVSSAVMQVYTPVNITIVRRAATGKQIICRWAGTLTCSTLFDLFQSEWMIVHTFYFVEYSSGDEYSGSDCVALNKS